MKGTVPILKKTLGKKEKTMILGRGVGKTTKNVNTPASRKRRFSLKDVDVILLSRWAKIIEKHYSKAMDIEWAKDGMTGKIYIVQARPETVQSRVSGTELITYSLQEPNPPEPLVRGTSIGQGILHGEVCVVHNVESLKDFRPGCILVTEITDPDWVSIMRKAAAIITDHGGRTCHAAIVSRELGIPAIGKQKSSIDSLESNIF
jgi:pyruvate,water dikinase